MIEYSDKDFFESSEELCTFFSCATPKENIHSHKFWELAYVYEGTALLCTQSGVEKLNSGEFAVISPESVHSITLDDENKDAPMWMCCCMFTQKYFDDIMNEYIKIRDLSCYSLYRHLNASSPITVKLADDNAQNVKHRLWAIAHEYNHRTVGSDYIIRSSLINLFVYATRLYEYKTTGISNVVSKSHEIDELAKYIRSHFGYNLSLEFLARNMHLSREYLSRYFKKHMGKTIFEYITEVRTEKAKQMLTTTTHSVSDICEYCGYNSIGNFQKSFKKVTGVSPSKYRKEHSGSEYQKN